LARGHLVLLKNHGGKPEPFIQSYTNCQHHCTSLTVGCCAFDTEVYCSLKLQRNCLDGAGIEIADWLRPVLTWFSVAAAALSTGLLGFNYQNHDSRAPQLAAVLDKQRVLMAALKLKTGWNSTVPLKR
jgi:hypothetical protein